MASFINFNLIQGLGTEKRYMHWTGDTSESTLINNCYNFLKHAQQTKQFLHFVNRIGNMFISCKAINIRQRI